MKLGTFPLPVEGRRPTSGRCEEAGSGVEHEVFQPVKTEFKEILPISCEALLPIIMKAVTLKKGRFEDETSELVHVVAGHVGHPEETSFGPIRSPRVSPEKEAHLGPEQAHPVIRIKLLFLTPRRNGLLVPKTVTQTVGNALQPVLLLWWRIRKGNQRNPSLQRKHPAGIGSVVIDPAAFLREERAGPARRPAHRQHDRRKTGVRPFSVMRVGFQENV